MLIIVRDACGQIVLGCLPEVSQHHIDTCGIDLSIHQLSARKQKTYLYAIATTEESHKSVGLRPRIKL